MIGDLKSFTYANSILEKNFKLFPKNIFQNIFQK